VALVGQVEQPARGADDHVDALAQRADLRLVRAAAVDRGHPHADAGAGGLQVASDLDAQLAGRDDDQRPRRRPAQLDALQQRDAEAEGLAGTRAGLSDQVAARECDRQRHLLDGERPGDPDVAERMDDPLVHSEVGEQRAVLAHVGAGSQRFELLVVTLRVDIVVLVDGGQCSASLAGADSRPSGRSTTPSAFRPGDPGGAGAGPHRGGVRAHHP
jgi:hypothetical protein